MIANATSGPVILTDLPARDYHAQPELSASQIHTIYSKGLRTYRHELTEPRSSTEDMDFGTVCHSILFGNPDKELLVWSGADRRTKAGKDEYASKQDEADAKRLLLVKEIVYADAIQVVDAVLHDPDVGAMLKAPGSREVSVFWNDDEIGTRCRMRADMIPDDPNLPIIDLKVTSSVPSSARRWGSKVMDFGYDVQDYHYRAGALASGFGLRDFWFVVVDRNPPHEVAVFTLTDDWRLRAASIRKKAATDLSLARLEGDFPKRLPGVNEVPMPAFAEVCDE